MRSANRNNANNAAYINSSGNANNNNANNALRAAPDCVDATRKDYRDCGYGWD